jgi:hypothetical protein
MKHIVGISCLALLASGALHGCISLVKVEKAKEETQGFRYVLPEMFLKVTPRFDGGLDVEPVYMPDPANEYAVRAESIMGNYTIDLGRSEEGFLTTVTFKADGTGVAKQLIDSAGNVYAAKLAADAEKQQKQEDKAQTAADKEAEAMGAAKQALSEAETNLKVAQSKLATLEALKNSGQQDLDDQILDAKLAVDEARVRRDAAAAALESKTADRAAANATKARGQKPLIAPEPVFFRIVMDIDTVKLVQAFPQEDRETWRVPKAGIDLPALEVSFAQGSSAVVRPSEEGALRFILSSNRLLRSVTEPTLRNAREEILKPGAVASLVEGGTTVVVDLIGNVPVGQYTFCAKFVLKTALPEEAEVYAISIPLHVEERASK